jgi:hypothetical protein
MRPISGAFLYPDEGSLYIPQKISIHSGWGQAVSVHVVGPDKKPLPNRMEITFFSYLEDKFYHGEFELPYERIKQMFAEGYFSDAWGKREKTTFSRIIAGMAPGGAVAVWVSGLDRQYEVFFGYAQPVDLPWHATTRMPAHLDRATEVLAEVDEAQQSDPLVAVYRKQLPVGLWESYRKRWDWYPVFEGVTTPRSIERMRYVNGERNVLEFPLDDAVRRAPRAAPTYMLTVVTLANGEDRSLEMIFDVESTRAAFEQIGATNKPFVMAITVSQAGARAAFTVAVRNEELTLPLQGEQHVRRTR